MRDNGAIEGGAAAFTEDDEVIVLKKYDASKIYVVAHKDGIRNCQFYLYCTFNGFIPTKGGERIALLNNDTGEYEYGLVKPGGLCGPFPAGCKNSYPIGIGLVTYYQEVGVDEASARTSCIKTYESPVYHIPKACEQVIVWITEKDTPPVAGETDIKYLKLISDVKYAQTVASCAISTVVDGGKSYSARVVAFTGLSTIQRKHLQQTSASPCGGWIILPEESLHYQPLEYQSDATIRNIYGLISQGEIFEQACCSYGIMGHAWGIANAYVNEYPTIPYITSDNDGNGASFNTQYFKTEDYIYLYGQTYDDDCRDTHESNHGEIISMIRDTRSGIENVWEFSMVLIPEKNLDGEYIY